MLDRELAFVDGVLDESAPAQLAHDVEPGDVGLEVGRKLGDLDPMHRGAGREHDGADRARLRAAAMTLAEIAFDDRELGAQRDRARFGTDRHTGRASHAHVRAHHGVDPTPGLLLGSHRSRDDLEDLKWNPAAGTDRLRRGHHGSAPGACAERAGPRWRERHCGDDAG